MYPTLVDVTIELERPAIPIMRRAHALHPSLAYERYRFLYVALRNVCA